MTLNDIPEKKEFVIVRLLSNGEIRKRLVDMGFISGTHGTVLRRALLKDPIELMIKGYRVSLRRSEAKQILVSDPAEQPAAQSSSVFSR